MSKTKTGGIKFDRNNYRTHDESNKRMIRESLEACGAGRSVLVDNQNELIAGNGVYEQAQKLGIPTRIIETDGTELVVVKRTDLEPEDKKRKQLAAADNAIADKVTWNAPAIRADFTPVEIQALNIDLPPVELNETPPPVEAQEDAFDEDTDTMPKRVKRGDVWQLGKHRVMCGDSTSADDVAKLMNGQTADMVFTDPPYEVQYKVKACASNKKTISKKRISGCKNETIINDDNFDNAYNVAKNALANTSDVNTHYVCCDWKSYATIQKAVRDAGIQQKACIVWDKGAPYQHLDKFAKGHEFIIYAGAFGGQKTVDIDIWKVQREFRADHPTPKPVALVGRAIGYSTNENNTVYDPFSGSGTTLIAAEQLGRTCFAMELDAHYCDVILARWEKLTGKQAVKL